MLALPKSVTLCAALLAIAGSARADEQELPVFRAPEVLIPGEGAPQCRPAQPPLPEQALAMDLTGTVTARYVLGADGRIDEVDTSASTAHPVLGQAVARWLDGCRAAPFVARAEWDDGAGVQGHAERPFPVRVTQEFVFHARKPQP